MTASRPMYEDRRYRQHSSGFSSSVRDPPAESVMLPILGPGVRVCADGAFTQGVAGTGLETGRPPLIPVRAPEGTEQPEAALKAGGAPWTRRRYQCQRTTTMCWTRTHRQ